MESHITPAPTVDDVAALAESVCATRYGPGSELNRVRYCCTLLRTVGEMPAARFGPNALRLLQGAMVTGWSNGVAREPLCRREVNRRVNTIRRCFRIAAGHELVPAAVPDALAMLEPLRAGRTTAREREPIRPVAEDVYRATLKHLSPTIRAMAEIQALTGMRTGELVALRFSDIDRTKEPWVYRVRHHKNEWRGQVREVPFGPKARTVLLQAITGLGVDERVFSPQREHARRALEQRKARKTPVQPSQRNRRKQDPKRAPGDHYSVLAYARAVTRACTRAQVQAWRPYQLRHSHLTKVRHAHGIEAAQAVGGHTSLDATEVYAEVNLARARIIAEAMG